MITRPLLAVAVEDLDSIKYPVIGTPKYDGVRCLKVNGQVVTRKFKPLPNIFARTVLESILPEGADGEIVCPGKSFNEVQSEIMSFDGEPVFEFHMFDLVTSDLNRPYCDRIKDMEKFMRDIKPNNLAQTYLKLVQSKLLTNKEQLVKYEEQCVSADFEGIIIRDPMGKYKCGRSTLKEGILLKIKRFTDDEAKIIGFVERMHNANSKEKDEFGLSKRSHKKDGMVPDNTLGALQLKNLKTGVEFELGTGFDDALRKEIWTHQKKYLGQLVKYKYQAAGLKEKPRFPVFLGFRNELDMD